MSERQTLATDHDETPAPHWHSYFGRRNGLAWVVLAIALLADLGAWYYLHQRERMAAREQFELLEAEIGGAIRKRMTDHEQILLGGAGLFDASLEVDRQEWNIYIERLKLEENYPGIQGVGFSRFLRGDELDAFETAVRDEGFQSFRVHPPGRREQYGAILFLEPFRDRNLAAFGFDMLSEPTRRAAMLDAARSGETRISGRVTLVQETHGKVQPGLLMYVPIYRQGQPLETPEQRLQALYGFVYSPYRMHDLMAGILGSQTPELDFAIYAGDSSAAEHLLYAFRSSPRHRPLLTSERKLTLYGQTWTLHFSSPPEFEAGFHKDLPMLLLGGGVALLLFFIATLLTQRRVQAEALARKMTERIRQSSAALSQSEERLRLVLKGSNDGWWDLDLPAGRFFASARAWEMLGYPPDEQPQPLDRWRQALHPDDLAGLQDCLREALETGADAFSHEARLQHRDGRELPALLRGFIQRDADGHAVRISGTTLDLSERKRIERMKNEFISTVSHELRTPLTSITGALGLINGGALGSVPPLMQQMLDIAQQNSQRLGHLINDLLDMDKLSAGKMIFDLRVQPIRPLIQEALIGNQAYAEKHGVSFRLDLSGEMQVRVDGLRLQQVLANFLSNAIKFSPPGSSVGVLGELRGSRVRISVSDQGPGIPEAFRPRIFQRFAQADGSDQRVQPGTGLGLAISKELMERMGGSVGFHSEEGQGATFWLELPLVEQKIPPNGEPSNSGAAKVLVVEDEPGIARLLQVMLGQAGYRVDCVSSVAQAREALAGGRYAAMTLDLRLPDEHGAAFIRDVLGKPDRAQMPILVISAYCDEGRKLLGELAEGLVWLDKPIDHQRLLKTLDQRISERTRPQATGKTPTG